MRGFGAILFRNGAVLASVMCCLMLAGVAEAAGNDSSTKAIVTPSPDMVNQTALAIPIIALYFIGVGVAFLFAKKPTA